MQATEGTATLHSYSYVYFQIVLYFYYFLLYFSI